MLDCELKRPFQKALADGPRADRMIADEQPATITVRSICIREGDDHVPYAAYKIQLSAPPDMELSAWRRWSACQAFAKSLHQEFSNAPRLSGSPNDLVLRPFLISVRPSPALLASSLPPIRR